MHELGIVMNVVDQMEKYMTENKLKHIEKIILQVGALSGVVPRYLTDVYPLVVENTKLAKTILEIDETPGIGICKDCDFRYDLIQNDHRCPVCSSTSFEIISGREFLIKEIHAY